MKRNRAKGDFRRQSHVVGIAQHEGKGSRGWGRSRDTVLARARDARGVRPQIAETPPSGVGHHRRRRIGLSSVRDFPTPLFLQKTEAFNSRESAYLKGPSANPSGILHPPRVLLFLRGIPGGAHGGEAQAFRCHLQRRRSARSIARKSPSPTNPRHMIPANMST